MVDCKDTRKDFPMLDRKTLMHGKPLIYFDNGATTLKPQCVIDAVCEYLSSYSGNAHRGDYDLSHQVDVAYEEAREAVRFAGPLLPLLSKRSWGSGNKFGCLSAPVFRDYPNGGNRRSGHSNRCEAQGPLTRQAICVPARRRCVLLSPDRQE